MARKRSPRKPAVTGDEAEATATGKRGGRDRKKPQQPVITVRHMARRDIGRVWDFLKISFRDVNAETVEYQRPRSKLRFEEIYEELIRAKTGSLIGAATEIGAGMNGAGRDPRRREKFREFGEKLGVAFQIIDDLFDYEGESDVTGKPVGYDLADGKVTLPLIAALRSASEADAARLRRLAGRKRWTTAQWEQLKGLIERCGGFDAARRRAAELADEALVVLRDEPAGAARQGLEAAVDYCVHRDH